MPRIVREREWRPDARRRSLRAMHLDPHRLFASIVIAGATLGSGCSCAESHSPDSSARDAAQSDGATGDDAGRLDATMLADATTSDAQTSDSAASDAPVSDAPRSDAACAGCDPRNPCSGEARCMMCFPCIL